MPTTIRLLGTIRFERDDGVLVDAEAVPTVRALDLLRLLAEAGETWRRADHYVALLWPAAGTDQHGRASLRTAIAQLRRTLGPDVVRRSGDRIGLGDVWTDVAERRRLAARVEDARGARDDRTLLSLVQESEESCGGDLVVSGSSCDAVYALRDDLQALRHQMLLDAAAAAASLRWMRASLELARLADSVRSTEATARALMVAWAGLGETPRAIDTFERLRIRLDDTYAVQPSPATRALYLQVVTAGDRWEPGPPECHLDKATELANAVRLLQRGPHPGGVVWLHGEPGSGRGMVALQARRMVEELPFPRRTTFELLPEVVALDDDESARIREEARDRRCVLVVPIRSSVRPAPSRREALVHVGRLSRSEFDGLVSQLLQDRPTPDLAARLWSTSDGLAGQACRTVDHLVRQDALAWTPAGMDLVSREPVCPTRRGLQIHPVAKLKALLAPLLVDLSAWVSSSESALVSVFAV
ncbi:AfsR/SARP family transcriptional regulator [Nocardioides sp. LHG3406-4]|uniref:AfsR/SARP family transcriptional regulator n=1 Tax=Nocardioides sp. LHG3406-4 TaxID=2804575 RepID=UPI003CF66B20